MLPIFQILPLLGPSFKGFDSCLTIVRMNTSSNLGCLPTPRSIVCLLDRQNGASKCAGSPNIMVPG